jgi:pyruvate dehydrogenase E1 component beta subunit
MATQILMPALSPTMEEGTLAKWLVKEGDPVSSGQIIAEIETDKATMEFEAVDEGRIGQILIPEGAEGVKVNTPIAVLLDEGEDASAAPAPEEKPAEVQAAKPAAYKAEPKRDTGAPAASQPAEFREAPEPEPEVPEGVSYKTQTVREALRDAMAEEMRRDETSSLWARRSASTRAPTRSAKACSTRSARSASSTRRSPSTASRGSRSARPLRGCGRLWSS